MDIRAPFRHEISPQPADIDQYHHVNNVVYVRWVQDVAIAHWQALASAEMQQKYAWMLLRHEIDYQQQAFLGDSVIGETWVGEAKGATFERFVVLRKGDTVLTRSRMVWCLMDAVSLKPRRIDHLMTELLKQGSIQ
ncbi:MAG: acyl-CoA thioesterase [Cyclobacteriaceae bacterium]|jgi:acyl-CoA thioester hydrolase|nr:acyl-CoA thioesterase [Flammeovirgaceae bacterium]